MVHKRYGTIHASRMDDPTGQCDAEHVACGMSKRNCVVVVDWDEIAGADKVVCARCLAYI